MRAKLISGNRCHNISYPWRNGGWRSWLGTREAYWVSVTYFLIEVVVTWLLLFGENLLSGNIIFILLSIYISAIQNRKGNSNSFKSRLNIADLASEEYMERHFADCSSVSTFIVISQNSCIFPLSLSSLPPLPSILLLSHVLAIASFLSEPGILFDTYSIFNKSTIFKTTFIQDR